jgi:hypothetical protein
MGTTSKWDGDELLGGTEGGSITAIHGVRFGDWWMTGESGVGIAVGARFGCRVGRDGWGRRRGWDGDEILGGTEGGSIAAIHGVRFGDWWVTGERRGDRGRSGIWLRGGAR